MTNFSLARRALSPCKGWRRSYNAVGAKMWCLLPAGLPPSVKHRRINFTQGQKSGFRPSGATRCTDTGQTLHCRRAPGSAWLCKILPKSAQRCGNAAQKYQKFPLFGKQWPSTGEPLDRTTRAGCRCENVVFVTGRIAAKRQTPPY